MVEVVVNLKYMVQTLDKTDNDWPAVRRNVMSSRLVWGRLETLLRREGSESKVS